jgi:hypothetical protein
MRAAGAAYSQNMKKVDMTLDFISDRPDDLVLAAVRGVAEWRRRG